MTNPDPEDDLDLTQLSARNTAEDESENTVISSRVIADIHIADEEIVVAEDDEVEADQYEERTQISRRLNDDGITRISDRSQNIDDQTSITGRKDHALYHSVTSNTTITPDDYRSEPRITKRRELRENSADRTSTEEKPEPERYRIRKEAILDAEAVELGNIAYTEQLNQTPQSPKVPGSRTIAIGITAIVLLSVGVIAFLFLF